MDPHLQLMFSCTSHALSDSGWTTKQTKSVGVFTALAPQDFLIMVPTYGIARALATTLKVDGPFKNVEAVCSSGYLAIAEAINSMAAQKCSMATVTGVSLKVKPDWALNALAMGVLSETGSMRPLDVSADGMVWGEAGASVVLSSNPARSGYARIHATAQNTTSTLLPIGFADPKMMGAAAEMALNCANISADSVAFTHLHAMGASASDRPEVAAMAKVFAGGDARAVPLVLASHKDRIGHTVSASGVLALIVSTLILEHRQVPSTIHVQEPLTKIRDTKDIVVPTGGAPSLLAVGSICSSISGTSASGDNVHIIMGDASSPVLSNLSCMQSMADQSVEIQNWVDSHMKSAPDSQPDEPEECEEALAALMEPEIDKSAPVRLPAVVEPREVGSKWADASIESLVAALVEEEVLEVLDCDITPDPDANLFEQGLGSKAGMALLQKFSTRAGAEVDIGDLFEDPSLSNLQAIVLASGDHNLIRTTMEARHLPAIDNQVVAAGGPTLSKEGHRTIPPLDVLAQMPVEKLRAVNEFELVRDGVGSIAWLGPVDLVDVNLDMWSIGVGEVQLLGDLPNGLKAPCLVSLHQMGVGDHTYAAQLRESVTAAGDEFVLYDPDRELLQFVLHSD
jgi:aryl carrier-like protein